MNLVKEVAGISILAAMVIMTVSSAYSAELNQHDQDRIIHAFGDALRHRDDHRREDDRPRTYECSYTMTYSCTSGYVNNSTSVSNVYCNAQ